MTERGTPGDRTVLAWQRTALAVVAGSLLTARLGYERSPVLTLVTLLVALPLAGWVLVEARSLRRQGVGLEAALLCGAVVVLGAVELVGQLLG